MNTNSGAVGPFGAVGEEPGSVIGSGVAAAIEAIARGQMVVVVDSRDRENEGDLVMAAQFADAASINFMATEGRGLICVAMTADRLEELDIPPMVARNTDPHHTAFHVSVDLHGETTTGISASDRAATLRALTDPARRPEDFNRPGHVFPLRGHAGGLLARTGHTEASLELTRLAGVFPAAVLCEIANADGEMARWPQLLAFARRHNLPIITVSDLATYQVNGPVHIRRSGTARLPIAGTTFQAIGFCQGDGLEHLALVLGDPSVPGALVRVHSECLTGDVFASERCDCGAQLEDAIAAIATEGNGAVIYVRGHEGRGIGLLEKLRAYVLQDDAGLDTLEANQRLGHPIDARNYTAAAAILRELGMNNIRLHTNNPDKIAALAVNGIDVIERVPTVVSETADNQHYLGTKRDRLGHLIELKQG